MHDPPPSESVAATLAPRGPVGDDENVMLESIEAAVAEARARPDDVAAQMAAAYACDRAGEEGRAVEFYDAAWRLGIPTDERADFMIGYGSTLRNVGRTDDALHVLAALLREHPNNHAGRCFYALALHSAGRSGPAVAELLDVALSLRQASGEITRYRRALAAYCEELKAADGPGVDAMPVL
jgi:tetratricopeptide (TPR) repeat protein